jgi:hypothetical protein
MPPLSSGYSLCPRVGSNEDDYANTAQDDMLPCSIILRHFQTAFSEQ